MFSLSLPKGTKVKKVYLNGLLQVHADWHVLERYSDVLVSIDYQVGEKTPKRIVVIEDSKGNLREAQVSLLVEEVK